MRGTAVFLPLLASASTGYAPQDSLCPAGPRLVRQSVGNQLSEGEAIWVSKRDSVTKDALATWLDNSELQNFDARPFLAGVQKRGGASTIRVGIAISGGGYRAMLTGAGVLAAFDGRIRGATTQGGMGGLLQATTYVTGLSGGSWLVGSVAANHWDPVPSLQFDKPLWDFQKPFEPTKKQQQHLQLAWDLSMAEALRSKRNAGFDVTITDLWGRMLSSQLLPGDDYGASLRWSDMIDYPEFANAAVPMPIIVADGINGTGNINYDDVQGDVDLNSTVYEFTPFEFGSWDPSVNAFVETRYLGTEFDNGIPVSHDCIRGFDNTGFIMGASSSLFNKIAQQIVRTSRPLSRLYNIVSDMLGGKLALTAAPISPNPFRNLTYAYDAISESETLDLLDGGEDGENVPLLPLVEPTREVDIVFAVDSSADTTTNWPSGFSLWSTYQRQFLPQGERFNFPEVPNPADFWQRGMFQQPAFFGCAVDRASNTNATVPPVVVNLPNWQYSYASNTSTWKVSYSPAERDGMIANGINLATQNQGNRDPEWRTCVACAVVLREQQRRGQSPTEQCQACFNRYCYS